jgi:type IX secretion system substrate protein
MFNIAPDPSNGGSYFIARIDNDAVTTIVGWDTSEHINPGYLAENAMSVQIQSGQVTFFINGVDVISVADATYGTGYIGTGFAEDQDVAGVVAWDYIAFDNSMTLATHSPGESTIDKALDRMASLDPEVLASASHAPAYRMSHNRPVKQRPIGFLTGGIVRLGESPTVDEIIEYRVYRNGDLIATPPTTDYLDTLPAFGLFEYMVTVYTDEGESIPTLPASVVWTDPNSFALNEDFDNGFPDTWVIEYENSTLTWIHSSDDPVSHNFFPTPYMLIDSDYAGSQAHVRSRLITPAIGLSGSSLAVLQYDILFVEYIDEMLQTAWTNDPGGTWYEIVTYVDDVEDPTGETFDLSEMLAGEDEVWFSWLYDDQENWGWYAALDNVLLIIDSPNPPVTLQLFPGNTVIPEEGGIVEYGVQLTGSLPQGHSNARFWTTIQGPQGCVYGPLVEYVFGVTADFDIHVSDLNQVIPVDAPVGQYLFTAYAGSKQNDLFRVSDSFFFQKSGAFVDGEYEFDPEEWPAGGKWIASEDVTSEISLPTDYEMEAAYPNPFNPSTTFAVTLPATSDLTVAVYNVTGQLVTTLANDVYASGRHTMTFDASNLASGLYFLRATVPGQLDQTQKIMLVR